MTIQREIAITLDWAEMLQAATAGAMRRIESVKRKLKPRNGFNDSGSAWQVDIEGALAECACAKALGIYWPGKGNLRAADVGDLQVRSTQYATGKLLIYPNDNDNEAFILVTGAYGSYMVRGWLYAREGKRAEWLGQLIPGSSNDPSYNVPQSALRPMETLITARQPEPA
jgi:hypothetical protein